MPGNWELNESELLKSQIARARVRVAELNVRRAPLLAQVFNGWGRVDVLEAQTQVDELNTLVITQERHVREWTFQLYELGVNDAVRGDRTNVALQGRSDAVLPLR